MSSPVIFANRIICPDGTILHSRHRHDFVRHVQDDGREYFLDGGPFYVRVGGSDNDYTLDTITDLNTHDEIREAYVWGKRSLTNSSGISWIRLKDMDSDHVENVISYLGKLIKPLDNLPEIEQSTQDFNNNRVEKIIQMLQNELRYRGETNKESEYESDN